MGKEGAVEVIFERVTKITNKLINIFQMGVRAKRGVRLECYSRTHKLWAITVQ